jgi:probable addiction module antidote protein
MALKLTRFDAADFLETDENIEYYLTAIAEDNDPVLMASALGDVARVRGMSQLSRETGISRMGLIKALSSDGNPSFAPITKVLDALGFRIDIVTKESPLLTDDTA